MTFYDESQSMPFYLSKQNVMLPPIVGLGAGANMEGPVTVSSSLPAFQAAAISAFSPSISPALSSLVLGIAAGTNGMAANALSQLYQHQVGCKMTIYHVMSQYRYLTFLFL